jgi:tetratricopeptide (TPR) repeat protein/DNA-binding CsgD family transcriptional regulator
MRKVKTHHFFYRIFIVLTIVFCSSSAIAQKTYASVIDSLKILIKEEPPADTLASLYSKCGALYYKSDSLFQAIVYKKKAAEIYKEEKNLDKYSAHLETIGILYSFINDFKQSLKYFLEALKILDDQNKKDEHYHSLIQNIGITYVEAEEAKKGIPYLITSLKYFESDTTASREYLVVAYVDLGVAYSKIELVDSSFYFYHKALAAAKRYSVSKQIGGILVNLGDLYESLNVYDKSKVYYKEALKYFSDNNDDRGYWHTIYGLACVEKDLKNTKTAEDSLLKAVKYFQKTNDLTYLKDSYKKLSEICEERNDITNAFKYYKLCSDVKDSIATGDQKNRMTELQMQYELQKTEIENANELALLQKENQLKIYKVYIIIGLLLIGILIISFFMFRLRTKKRLMESKFDNSQLEQKHLMNEIEYKNKELESFALHIVHKNDFLDTIKSGLAEIKDSTDIDNKQKIKSLSLQITQSLRRNKDLEKFQEKIDQVHGSFIKQLSEKFPDLSEKEKRLCVLLKLNLSSKEIATLNNISENAVVMARYRMRKKMGLNSEENLTEFIQKMN